MKRALLLLVLAGGLVGPRPAHAYLDPATGSAMLQILIGSLMGGLFVMKRYWGQLKARFTRKSVADAKPTAQEPGSDGDRG